ncbi:hypothetical protein CH373_11295 [Leptospira perolatii]|uniref:Tetratricopeptide repeat protein n=1 Tax=Leptospira perolatii TaxID=2023191 RepID=A0A2M9ZMA6_9LEPT|nr:hypothetical protein [Leptospira perolatii]PJZ69712.1 hypothetical protein CH360_08940 [Leptospira perolatii]PJZ73073.1 hypothetical protein CH373_11295 [Leptospira perolatii]
MAIKFKILIPSLFILLGFLLTAIYEQKIAQLNWSVGKNQLFKYEFSSELLKKRIIAQSNENSDLSSEIRVNLEEANLFSNNGIIPTYRPTYIQVIGTTLVNGVRFLTLKRPLEENIHNGFLQKIQNAFYYERTMRCDKAKDYYESILSEHSDFVREANDIAFVRLHYGYCLFVTGDLEKALENFRIVKEVRPGSSFSESAHAIEKLIEEAKVARATQESETFDKRRKLELLLRSGDFASIISETEKTDTETPEVLLIRAKALEKTGRFSDALGQYLSLSAQREKPNIAKSANARLLLIGHVFLKDERIITIAENNAKALGDQKTVEVVRSESKSISGNGLLDPSYARESNDPNISKQDQETEKDQKPETDLGRKDLINKELDAQLASYSGILKKKNSDSNVLELELSDGRHLLAKFIQLESNVFKIKTSTYGIDVPFSLLKSIRIKNGASGSILITSDSKKGVGTEIQHVGESLILKGQSGEMSFADKSIRSIHLQ